MTATSGKIMLAAYTSFIHLATALIRKVNAFSINIEFLQLYSHSKLLRSIANKVKLKVRLLALQEYSRTHAIAGKSEYNTVVMWPLNL